VTAQSLFFENIAAVSALQMRPAMTRWKHFRNVYRR
jgi:hypothetical protein